MEALYYEGGDRLSTTPERLSRLDALHRKSGNIINILKGKTAFVAKATISTADIEMSNKKEKKKEVSKKHSKSKFAIPREIPDSPKTNLRVPISLSRRTMTIVKSKNEKEESRFLDNRCNYSNASCTKNKRLEEKPEDQTEEPSFFDKVVNAIFGDTFDKKDTNEVCDNRKDTN